MENENEIAMKEITSLLKSPVDTANNDYCKLGLNKEGKEEDLSILAFAEPRKDLCAILKETVTLGVISTAYQEIYFVWKNRAGQLKYEPLINQKDCVFKKIRRVRMHEDGHEISIRMEGERGSKIREYKKNKGELEID